MIVVTSFFDGIAWPAAQPDGDIEYRDDFLGKRTVFQIKTTGRGRKSQWDDTRAFWRNFAHLNIHSEADVLDFVKRRGDPFGHLSAENTQTDTGQWEELVHYLRPLHHLWSKPDEETGESHIVANQNAITSAMEHLTDWKEFTRSVQPNLYIDREDGQFKTMLRTTTLAGFMMANAMLQTQARATMVRCAHCADYFTISRKARFCSASCRALYSTANVKGRTHG